MEFPRERHACSRDADIPLETKIRWIRAKVGSGERRDRRIFGGDTRRKKEREGKEKIEWEMDEGCGKRNGGRDGERGRKIPSEASMSDALSGSSITFIL